MNSKEILVIEDNELCQVVYKGMFKRLNCPMVLAGTATEAIALVHQHQYPCILADWGLPDAEGDSLVQAIRATPLNKRTPIFVISAHASPDTIRTCESLGVQGVYTKPLMADALEALIAPYR